VQYQKLTQLLQPITALVRITLKSPVSQQGMASTMARTRVTLRNPQKKRPPGEHPTQRFIRQQFMMNENNEILHAEEEEDGDEQPDGKQAAETQQPSPQPNMERRATKKNRKAIEHSVSIASVMDEIRREAETNTPSQSPTVASLPATAGDNSRGSRNQSYDDTRQVQGGSINTSNEEEYSDDGDNQGQYDEEEEAENSGNDDDIDEDTARTEKYLRLYFHSLAKSGTIRTVEEEFNLVTAKLGQVFKCQKFIISDRDLSEQGLIAQIMFQEMEVPNKFREVWWEEMKSHVCKKMDERCSNCGTSIKKGLLGK